MCKKDCRRGRGEGKSGEKEEWQDYGYKMDGVMEMESQFHQTLFSCQGRKLEGRPKDSGRWKSRRWTTTFILNTIGLKTQENKGRQNLSVKLDRSLK